MKTTLSRRSPHPVLLFVILFLSSARSFSQTWTLANAYGGSVAAFIDKANAVCTDASGNVYITGQFHETINFGNGTATLTAVLGAGTHIDGFVAKFNSSGLCQWSARFGGGNGDLGGLGIATDGVSVFVTGGVQPTSLTVNATPVTNIGGSTDGIVFSLNATTGATNWASSFGGVRAGDAGQAACLDGSGNLYISGKFITSQGDAHGAYFGSAALVRLTQGDGVTTAAISDMFVARLNPATGAFVWVSNGGVAATLANIENDNVTGSGITYAAASNELVVTGSFFGGTANYLSNGVGPAAVTLTNAGASDIYVLEMDLSGNFLSGFSAGGTNADEGLAITYDASTSAVYITGYFNSASIAGAFSLTNSAGGFDEIFYARFNPAANNFPWAKNASGTAGGNDAGFAIASNGNGAIFVTGRLQGTVNFPTASVPLTSGSAGADDIFLVKVNAANGNAMTIADADGATGTDVGFGIANTTGGNLWVGGVFADNTLTFVPSSPTISITAALDQEIFLARYNDPSPVIGTQPSASTACVGLPVSFSVGSITGGSGFTYQWQESATVGFAVPVTLTNTGIYSNVTTATLNISDNTTVNGKFYRVIVTNSAGNSVISNVVSLTTTTPTMPTGNLLVSQAVNTSNNLYYGSSCRIVSKVVPSGATPVSGTISSETWVEGAVPTYGGKPFVQRHYQITPAAGSTATVTLYFTQTDFDNFNAVATTDLPMNSADISGKANMRISKFNGSSSGGGLPASYSGAASLLDPVDANIVWNATFSRWEVTLDVSGFSGFFVQTSLFVLPVNLLSFSAQPANNDIQLKWQTASESNNDHFELQRSVDGRNFTAVTQVPGINGTDIKNYGWNDIGAVSLNATKLYYRLKIVGLSGGEEYSNTVIVYLKKDGAFITAVTPNPFSNLFNIGLNMPRAGKITIKLADMNGAVLHKEFVQAPKGFSTHTITGMEKITAGIYLLSAEYEGQVEVYKLVK